MENQDTSNQSDQGNTGAKDQKDENQTSNSKTFSQDEVNEIVRKRVNEVNSKTEETISKKIQEAQADWERKQKMTDEERLSEESKKRAGELASKEREIALRENRADARELLQAKEISTELVDYVVDVDPKKTAENVEVFAKAYNKAVEEGVKRKVSGTTPKDDSAGSQNTQKKDSSVRSF